jgi:hypothetical protein
MVRSLNTTLFARNAAPQEATPYTWFRPTASPASIAMVMGAKNMTMTEVQHARRVGRVQHGETGISQPILGYVRKSDTEPAKSRRRLRLMGRQHPQHRTLEEYIVGRPMEKLQCTAAALFFGSKWCS